MNPETRFSSELEQLSELPDAFGDAIRSNLERHEIISLLIHKPAEAAGPESSPPKVLAVTDCGFIFVESKETNQVRAVRYSFDDVLLVELATLLLYGHLKIDCVEGGNRASVMLEYNGVSHDLYRRAVELILAGSSPAISAAPWRASTQNPLDLADWPKHIRSAAEFAMLADTPLHTGAWWPGVHAGFGHELAPAGAVLARESRLTVVTLEQSWPWDRVRPEPTYAIIATYLPAGRIADVDIHRTPKLAIVNLEMHARLGGEQFQLAVPMDREAAVHSVINDVLSRAPSAVSHEHENSQPVAKERNV